MDEEAGKLELETAFANPHTAMNRRFITEICEQFCPVYSLRRRGGGPHLFLFCCPHRRVIPQMKKKHNISHFKLIYDPSANNDTAADVRK